MASLGTGSNETGFSVDVWNWFLKELKPVPVYSVYRLLGNKGKEIVNIHKSFASYFCTLTIWLQ